MSTFDQADIHRLYSPASTLADPLPKDPFAVFTSWFDDAHVRRIQPNPNAFTLATIDADGSPSARIVLCKRMNRAAGYICFFTNYQGRKGLALDANPRAAAVFHWDHLDRQVRIEGPVVRSPAWESDEYFNSRPWESRIGAWSSNQSRPIASRAALLEQVAATMARFGLDAANPPAADAAVNIPRPPHWGGFRIWAQRVELWLAGPGRVHDRAVFTRPLTPATDQRDGPTFTPGAWSAQRLQP